MKRNIIRQLYFYAASLITLVIMVVATGQLVNLALKSTIFPKADDAYRMSCDEEGNRMYGYESPSSIEKIGIVEGETVTPPAPSDEEKAARRTKCEKAVAEERASQRQMDFVNNFSMLLVSTPVFWFHFRIAQREREEENERVKKEA